MPGATSGCRRPSSEAMRLKRPSITKISVVRSRADAVRGTWLEGSSEPDIRYPVMRGSGQVHDYPLHLGRADHVEPLLDASRGKDQSVDAAGEVDQADPLLGLKSAEKIQVWPPHLNEILLR